MARDDELISRIREMACLAQTRSMTTEEVDQWRRLNTEYDLHNLQQQQQVGPLCDRSWREKSAWFQAQSDRNRARVQAMQDRMYQQQYQANAEHDRQEMRFGRDRSPSLQLFDATHTEPDPFRKQDWMNWAAARQQVIANDSAACGGLQQGIGNQLADIGQGLIDYSYLDRQKQEYEAFRLRAQCREQRVAAMNIIQKKPRRSFWRFLSWPLRPLKWYLKQRRLAHQARIREEQWWKLQWA